MVLHEDDARARAARVAGRSELETIRTVRLHAEVIRDPEPEAPLSYDATPNVAVDTTEAVDAFTVTVDFDVRVHQGAGTDDVALVALKVIAFYSLGSIGDEPEILSDEEFRAFADTSGVFTLYPYIRETVATLTARLGLPPLTMPLLKSALVRDTTDVAELDVPATDQP